MFCLPTTKGLLVLHLCRGHGQQHLSLKLRGKGEVFFFLWAIWWMISSDQHLWSIYIYKYICKCIYINRCIHYTVCIIECMDMLNSYIINVCVYICMQYMFIHAFIIYIYIYQCILLLCIKYVYESKCKYFVLVVYCYYSRYPLWTGSRNKNQPRPQTNHLLTLYSQYIYVYPGCPRSNKE